MVTRPPDIQSVLRETRLFPPPPDFAARARVRDLDTYRREHRRSLEDPEGFWGDAAAQLLWYEPWQRVLEWEPPFARWFVGGRTNLSANCLDRHLDSPRADKTDRKSVV